MDEQVVLYLFDIRHLFNMLLLCSSACTCSFYMSLFINVIIVLIVSLFR